MNNVISDIRFAVRSLARTPGFTLAAVLTLGLGISANAAVFSVINGVLFEPLPYDNPNALALVWHRFSNANVERSRLSGPDFSDYQREAALFQGFAAAWAIGTNLSEEGEAEQITLSWVSTNFFDLLGVDPVLGRTFVPEDKTTTDLSLLTDPSYEPPHNVVMLSYELWQRRYGADATVIGRVITINSQSMTVIGVAPRGFRLLLPVGAEMPSGIDAWTLFPTNLADGNRAVANLTVLARLAPDVSIQAGQNELSSLAQRLRERHEVHERLGTEVSLAPMHDAVVSHVRPVLLLLLGAVGFVLLIACANVANLLLVRSASRNSEFAIRRALGGSRGRIAQQVLTESALLALAGAVVGIAFANWGVDLLLLLRPDTLPRADAVQLDGTVLVFVLGTTVLCALLFGITPALQSSADGVATLRIRDGAPTSRHSSTLRSGLAVGEIALSMVLLIGAGLLLRSFILLNRVQPGFNPEGLVTARVSLPYFSYRDAETRAIFFERLTERVANLPGVEAVSGLTPLPLSGGDGQDWTGPYALRESDGDDWASNEADYRPVLPNFLRTMETRLLRGRGFTRADNAQDARRVVVIDDVLARRVWPDADPLGAQLRISVLNAAATGSEAVWAEVVGIAEHARLRDLRIDGPGTIYVPYRAYSWFELGLILRTTVDPVVIGDAVRAVASDIDKAIPIFQVRPMQEYVADAVAPTRFVLVLLSVFALAASALATVGIFGVVSFTVRQRMREFGVRIALGANDRNIADLVLKHGLGLSAAGVLLGVAGAVVMTRMMSGLLFGVTPTDPIAFVVMASAVTMVTLVATYLPARKATRLDPVEVLRSS